MARWESGARQRLQGAALDLYARQGFEQTTVADIAAAVGLSERTFFRHFTDKREVLFDGQESLVQLFVQGATAAPPDATPLEAVAAALTAAATEYFPEDRREYSRRRQMVIDATAGLAERELLKMGVLAGAIAQALRDRGVAEPVATLAAESGVTAFRVAFGLWVTEGEPRTLIQLERDVLAQLGEISAPGSSASSR